MGIHDTMDDRSDMEVQWIPVQNKRKCFNTGSTGTGMDPNFSTLSLDEKLSHTGDSRYVDFAYLDTITYVEVIFHSQHFFSMYLCISTPSMSKTVNMKQRVSRGDFSCPRHIFYYICYFLCRSQKSALTRAPYCLFWLCTCT